MIEIWKDIKGFEGLYKVSNLGRIFSYPRPKTKGGICKIQKDSSGYLYYMLNRHTAPKIHKLVYETFVGSIPKGYDVHHKDHNKENNYVDNLELVEHIEHSKIHNTEKAKTLSKAVLQYTKQMEFVAEYPSTMEAHRQTQISEHCICYCCNNKYGYKTAGGYIWKYKNETN